MQGRIERLPKTPAAAKEQSIAVNEPGGTRIVVRVQRLPQGEGLPLPTYQTRQSAGMDLLAAVESQIELLPGEVKLIPTGIRIALPEGYEAQVRPRSGLALRHGITVLNTPGTVDSDYRGPVCVIMHNAGSKPFVVRRGDRIAQMVVAPVCRAELQVVAELDDTSRGQGGFGSTGTSGQQTTPDTGRAGTLEETANES
jgi:dUTP pyrophosphatase